MQQLFFRYTDESVLQAGKIGLQRKANLDSLLQAGYFGLQHIEEPYWQRMDEPHYRLSIKGLACLPERAMLSYESSKAYPDFISLFIFKKKPQASQPAVPLQHIKFNPSETLE
ncbi:hypothetical protein DQG23_33440 [Paenibacillus contaminans]|uniref:Uncharacterized protein n=1 Tax=Paenibacillus contaminans TaxID=450362 RepID=A0A329M085_9BACL|nr:hypothetical protein DQG23_33440 [Paenibacillus contaminans]